MQLSERTIEVLKNFATINQSIVVKPGNKLSTMAIARNSVAEAKVEETFESEFAIYNLNEFLNSLSLFEKPVLEFQDKFVFIKEKDSKRGGLKYFFANKQLIVYTEKEIKMPEDVSVKFKLTKDNFIKLNKAAGILNVDDIAIVGDEEGISLVVQDKKNTSANDYEVSISNESVEDEFKFYLKQEYLKAIPMDYEVQISPNGICLFTSTDGLVKYAVALEKE